MKSSGAAMASLPRSISKPSESVDARAAHAAFTLFTRGLSLAGSQSGSAAGISQGLMRGERRCNRDGRSRE